MRNLPSLIKMCSMCTPHCISEIWLFFFHYLVLLLLIRAQIEPDIARTRKTAQIMRMSARICLLGTIMLWQLPYHSTHNLFNLWQKITVCFQTYFMSISETMSTLMKVCPQVFLNQTEARCLVNEHFAAGAQSQSGVELIVCMSGGGFYLVLPWSGE